MGTISSSTSLAVPRYSSLFDEYRRLRFFVGILRRVDICVVCVVFPLPKFGSAEAVFGDETGFVIEWCINLAAVMVDEERAARSKTQATSLQEQRTRQWVWERFRNLELGMMSNGLPRP